MAPRPRACHQRDLCSYWNDCPYKRDLNVCRMAELEKPEVELVD